MIENDTKIVFSALVYLANVGGWNTGVAGSFFGKEVSKYVAGLR